MKEWSWGKTLCVSLPLFAVGFVVTYLGFKAITANPDSTEQEVELFFLYCSPQVALMTVALFQLVRKVKLRASGWVAMMANITQCGLGIYLCTISWRVADMPLPITCKCQSRCAFP